VLAVSTTGWWVIGWLIGAAVVVVAVILLLAIIALARRIVRQAAEITAALDGARENTNVLFDLATTNLALDRITRGLERARKGQLR
jgi:anti-sigma-K factor RskA